MTFRDINAVKNVQLRLEECGLYPKAIDGVWGGGCRDGAIALFADHMKANGIKDDPGFIKMGTIPFDVIKELQMTLQAFGLYSGTIDGLWGRGTATGLDSVVAGYKQRHALPKYNRAWSKRVSPQFIQLIEDWVKTRGLPADAVDWLMACMNFESGGTFDPRIQNIGGSNYFGLIQFGEMAAKDLGYALRQVIAMDQLTQLKLVFAYFDMWAKRGKKYTQLEDFYLTILYPAAVGMKADETLWRKDLANGAQNKNYVQNRGFDKNKDGLITIGEICTTIYASYFDGMLTKNRGIL
ncbi:hypothetical protein AVA65_07390 [Salmonella enterica subsp. enterica serovar Minnesota]|nr:hypothetical protein [Salmonella enterica subsp. enterica serovar Minnesota]